jgi:hypothetical protein
LPESCYEKERFDVPIAITEALARDIRFPTSEDLSGSDAMNEAPDYSAAYVILRTDTELEGHGFTFTIGRGNELCVAPESLGALEFPTGNAWASAQRGAP